VTDVVIRSTVPGRLRNSFRIKNNKNTKLEYLEQAFVDIFDAVARILGKYFRGFDIWSRKKTENFNHFLTLRDS